MTGKVDRLTGLSAEEAYNKRTQAGFLIRRALFEAVDRVGGPTRPMGQVVEDMINDAALLRRDRNIGRKAGINKS